MKTAITHDTDTAVFKRKLRQFQKVINQDIADYAKQLQTSTSRQYGKNARLEIDVFLEILARGGKRLRGALLLLGYEMSGGKDRAVILPAARAVEMLHAYLLITDDIQDCSAVRRGGPSAHVILADYHRTNYQVRDAAHFGLSMALNAALAGAHTAQMILADLKVPAELRLQAIGLMNQTLLTTVHGQSGDIINQVAADADEPAIENVLRLKTAHYTFVNPLQVGMALAGAARPAREAIAGYALHTGIAFQITDDMTGTFGSEQQSGKNPMDDIREGKRTLLAHYALKHASPGDKNFLNQTLGKRDLTPAEFERCKAIMVQSGALGYVSDKASYHINTALESLAASRPEDWPEEGVAFLRGLAQYIVSQKLHKISR